MRHPFFQFVLVLVVLVVVVVVVVRGLLEIVDLLGGSC